MSETRTTDATGDAIGARHAADPPADGRADFDFELGRWQVHSRRLKTPLQEGRQGSEEWEEFVGVSHARRALNGLAMIDEITNERPTGPVQGVTVRLFDPQSQQWSIYFAGNMHGSLVGVEQGLFTPPLIGRFHRGRGVFLGHERIGSQHVYTRYVWLDITPVTYRWEQAFSSDGGSSWETNWIQLHTRLSE
jgi:hypothetical protein